MLTPSPRSLEFVLKLPASTANKYEIVEEIATGGYGEVHKAFLKGNKDAGFFALKSNRFLDLKGKITSVDCNEIRALKMLENDKNIIKMIELVREKDKFAIVLELCKSDLTDIIFERNITLPLCDIKNILKQVFNGLTAMHRLKLMHRDLKPGNVLLAMDGTIKISDFGNSIVLGSKHNYDVNVCTLWYKAPELIFGYRYYDEKVDMWSAGCIAAEFWMKEAGLFRGESNTNQMEIISKICGFCSESIWPQAKRFPNYREFNTKFGKYTENNLHSHLTKLTKHEEAAVFMGKLLKLAPHERMTAENALTDEFFSSAPAASNDLNHLLEQLNKQEPTQSTV